MDELDILPIIFGRADSNYLGSKPVCNLPKNMSSTRVLLLMSELRQLVINEMSCPDVAMVIGPMLASEQLVFCVEGFQHLVLFILKLTLPKNPEILEVTRQNV